MNMKNVIILRLSFLSIMFLFLFTSLSAKNEVVIATIGMTKPSFSRGMDPQEMVDRMIDIFKGELSRVLSYKPDLIVLPEGCDHPTDLSKEDKANYFKARKNQIFDYFASVAKENNCYIAYGTIRDADDGYRYNSLVVIDRTGKQAGVYNKNFLTIGEMESGLRPGTEAPLIQCDFGTVAGAICFDLNFDELLEKYESSQPDIIIFPSMYHGGLVQSKWAYASRAFFVSAGGNRDIPSEIRNPLGEIVASSTNYFRYTVGTVNLDAELAHLDFNWSKLTKLKEKYGPDVTITDPGKLGSVLISSEHENITVNQMIKEFEIELLDDYMKRSRDFRNNNLGLVKK